MSWDNGRAPIRVPRDVMTAPHANHLEPKLAEGTKELLAVRVDAEVTPQSSRPDVLQIWLA